MPFCHYLTTCPYFNNLIESIQLSGRHRSNQNADIRTLVSNCNLKYCTSNYAFCARHRVAKAIGETAVPEDLYPDQVVRAKSIIQKDKHASSEKS